MRVPCAIRKLLHKKDTVHFQARIVGSNINYISTWSKDRKFGLMLF